MDTEYRIVNRPFGKFTVEALCSYNTSYLFRKPSVSKEWLPLDEYGRPLNCLTFSNVKVFDSISEAKVFIKWLQSDKVYKDI